MEEFEQAANADVQDVSTSEGLADPIETPESDPITPEGQGIEEITQTQAFSKRLKEETSKYQERQDKFAQRYGYSNFAEMEQVEAEREAEAQRQQFREQNGFDPDVVKPLFEEWKQSDPDFKELSQIRQENKINNALSELNNELKDNGLDLQLNDLSDAEVAKIPNADKVTEYVAKGHSLADAFFLANKKEIISKQAQSAQQDAIKKITANGESSPGPLGGGGDNNSKSIYSMSKDDFQKMQEEVMRGERKKL